jgi:peptide-methionine (S)-S-oxide reductase
LEKLIMSKDNAEPKKTESAVLGAGCFWCTEAVFQLIRGVESVEPGYAGGDVPNPTYEEVSTGTTGHVEVAKITFDPTVISFREVLEIFFGTHDPTQLNRQGADVGTQYRSVIFYGSPEQKATAEQLVAELTSEKVYGRTIVTKVEPLKAFYPAETYHKDYFKKHPQAPYCQVVIAPKIAKLQKTYFSKLKLP